MVSVNARRVVDQPAAAVCPSFLPYAQPSRAPNVDHNADHNADCTVDRSFVLSPKPCADVASVVVNVVGDEADRHHVVPLGSVSPRSALSDIVRPKVPDNVQETSMTSEPSSNRGARLGLHIDTSLATPSPAHLLPDESRAEPYLRQSASTASLPRRMPSLRAVLSSNHSSAGSLSPVSMISSPQLTALENITPLPSPITYSSGWFKSGAPSRPLSRASSTTSRREPSLRRIASNLSSSPPAQRQLVDDVPPLGLDLPETPAARDDKLTSPPMRRPRKVTISDLPPAYSPTDDSQAALHREMYLAVRRGLAVKAPPTPPRSDMECSEGSDAENQVVPTSHPTQIEGPLFRVKSVKSMQNRLYRGLEHLGKGTFSTVILAVREDPDKPSKVKASTSTAYKHPYVAMKVVEYGPAGGADESRVEVSLKREVEILKTVNHPSIVQLKACGYDKTRAFLALNYCPGRDLFEFTCRDSNAHLLTPPVIRRIFSELVGATRYLHEHYIVHRDIKLENVLVNIPAHEIQAVTDWTTYPHPLVTLSDLGLSRRIPLPPESQLLHTRCGSEDYAAPEIIMAQPYDGRASDAWALGVLLYALLESRLPFDALPGTRGDPARLRARVPHRICRLEWSWYKYGEEEDENGTGGGDWDAVKGAGLEGARKSVESLLQRGHRRISLDELSRCPWVRDAIVVPGGLRRGEIEGP